MKKLFCSNPNCSNKNPQLIDNFYLRKTTRRGHFSRCKTCIRQQPKIDRRSTKTKKRNEMIESGLCICCDSQCKYKMTPQPVKNFRVKRKNIKTGRITYHSYCQECELRRLQIAREKNKTYKSEYLLHNCCFKCGETDKRVLEFHHNTKTKYRGVGYLTRNGGLSTLIKEINKCKVVCKNCHMILHFSKRHTCRKNVERNRNYDIEHKEKHPCPCGESNPVVLVYHHRDPSIKTDGVSQIINKGSSLAEVQLEIKKCDILCHNCHVIFHYEAN